MPWRCQVEAKEFHPFDTAHRRRETPLYQRRVPQEADNSTALEIVRRTFLRHGISPGTGCWELLATPRHQPAMSLVEALRAELQQATSQGNNPHRQNEVETSKSVEEASEAARALAVVNNVTEIATRLLRTRPQDSRSAKAARKKVCVPTSHTPGHLGQTDLCSLHRCRHFCL